MSAAAIATALAVGGLVFVAIRRGASPAPLALLVLIFIPWLPLELPPALLLWSGRLSWLVWVGVAAGLAIPFLRGVHLPGRPEITAGALAFLLGAVAFWQVSPQVPGGDEPHYLVIAQSLLYDGDLKIENNHRERHYESYFAGLLRPDFIQRGRNGEIYSIHAPGVSALVAPAFVIAGYPGTVVFLLLLSAAGSALMWHLAHLVTGRTDAAWFGWAAVALSSTWIFHSFTVYPDGPGAVLVLTGVWALVRATQEGRTRSDSVMPWLLHGAALAALPWMHTRFSVLAGGLGALVLLRLPHVPNAAGKAFAFLIIPAISFLGWLTYFISIYGTPNPAAPYGTQQVGGFQYVPDGLGGLLFDQGFGLLMYAPVLVFGFVGIGIMLARAGWRRYALEHLFVLLPYLIVVTHFPMWWGGRSAPARFFVPVLLWMAIPAALAWSTMLRRATRATALAALVFTVFASSVLVFAEDGGLAFNERETFAQWLAWLNGSVDLAHALPMWWRSRELPLFSGIGVWGIAAVLAWLLLRGLDSLTALRPSGRFAAAAGLAFAAAGSLSSAVMWQVHDVSGKAPVPAQLDVLRRLSEDAGVLPVSVSSASPLDRREAARRLQIVPPSFSGLGGAGRNDRPLYSVPAIPAGEYRLQPVVRGTSGWVMVGIGRDQFAMQTEPVTTASRGLTVNFPVDVRALVIRGDEAARGNIRSLLIQPERIVLPEERISSGFARHAVRYGEATVFFMDERSYPEPEAFWVGGSRDSEVVIHPDVPRTRMPVLLRNGATDNVVTISIGRWMEELRMAPGEERQLDLPLDAQKSATPVRISSAAGFRPSAVDPKSGDHRNLGVWVRVGG